MLPNDVMALLIMIANARDDNHIDYYRQQAQQLLEKYKRPAGNGPTEYKMTTETPIPEWY